MVSIPPSFISPTTSISPTPPCLTACHDNSRLVSHCVSSSVVGEGSCAPSSLSDRSESSEFDAVLPVIVSKLGLYVSGTMSSDSCSVDLPHVMLDTGASLTFMEEKFLYRLGISRSELVSLSSVGVPRLVVADGRPMPVLGVVPRLKLSLGTLSPETVRVVVVKSLCGADVILGSDFLLASGATVCLGSVPPSLSLASGTIPIRFNEIEPVAVHCEVSVEVPGDAAHSFSSSVSSVVDPPAVGEGPGLLTRSNPQSFSSSVSSVVDPPAVGEGPGLLTRSNPQSFSSSVSSVVDPPAVGEGPGLLTRSNPQSFSSSVSSVVDPPAVGEGPGLLTRSNPQSFSSSVSSVVDPPAVGEGPGLLTRSNPQSFSSFVSSVVDPPAVGEGSGLLTRSDPQPFSSSESEPVEISDNSRS